MYMQIKLVLLHHKIHHLGWYDDCLHNRFPFELGCDLGVGFGGGFHFLFGCCGGDFDFGSEFAVDLDGDF